MVVEPAINSKKPNIHARQNIIGKGVASLDDFSEYTKVKLIV